VRLYGASLLAMRPHDAKTASSKIAAAHLKLASVSSSSRRDVDYRLLDARLKQLMAKPAMVGLASESSKMGASPSFRLMGKPLPARESP
jgi:beta-lactamase class C